MLLNIQERLYFKELDAKVNVIWTCIYRFIDLEEAIQKVIGSISNAIT